MALCGLNLSFQSSYLLTVQPVPKGDCLAEQAEQPKISSSSEEEEVVAEERKPNTEIGAPLLRTDQKKRESRNLSQNRYRRIKEADFFWQKCSRKLQTKREKGKGEKKDCT